MLSKQGRIQGEGGFGGQPLFLGIFFNLLGFFKKKIPPPPPKFSRGMDTPLLASD